MPLRDFVKTTTGTFAVALVLCLACSAVVSVAAVALKPLQEANKALDKKKNILLAAGLVEPSASSADVASIYEEQIVAHWVDLATGETLDLESEDLPIDPKTYDPRKAANDKDQQVAVEKGGLPGIAHREPFAEVYEIVTDGKTQGYILPIYGKGLWSTLFGFLAVEADGATVKGITYYSHAETPGLGGEVDNPNWKAQWAGKKVYKAEGEVGLGVVKGKASDEYGVDGLSGATITSKGVDDMIKYWLGSNAFGKYLANKAS